MAPSPPQILHLRRRGLSMLLTDYSVAIGLALRLFVAWVGPLLLDEGKLFPGVAYTDIDYHVFSDAADHVRNNESPYNRHTYRYTPFLAMLLARLPHEQAGRYLFCIADTICGWMILQLRQRQRTLTSPSNSQERHLSDALWWLYNPLAINICTRGSAESLVVLLPVLSTLWIVSQWKRHWGSAVIAGLCHGIAIHCKLYPIIYSVSFAICFVPRIHLKSESPSSFVPQLLVWTGRLICEPLVWLFVIATVATFAGLTYASYQFYGYKALQESLLYHFARTDHRHNYSMHWYSIYLAQAAKVSLPGLVYFVPQVLLLALLSFRFAEQVELALFLETFVFVALNKVITAQYFTWYLCLLPLCSDSMEWTRFSLQRSLAVWLLSMLVWLFAAYRLEIVGMLYYRWVWLASVLDYVANINLGRGILRSVKARSHRIKIE